MKEQWDSLENYLRDSDPGLLADLNSPATDAEIERLEASLKVRLPEEFVAIIKVHNGQKGRGEWLFEGKKFLPIQELLMMWTTLCSLEEEGDFDDSIADPQKGIKNCWWSKGWIPITSNGLGDHLCLDLDPAPEGVNGQIITFLHDSPKRTIAARSFGIWITGFIDNKVS